jgi:hypothetical protein
MVVGTGNDMSITEDDLSRNYQSTALTVHFPYLELMRQGYDIIVCMDSLIRLGVMAGHGVYYGLNMGLPKAYADWISR